MTDRPPVLRGPWATRSASTCGAGSCRRGRSETCCRPPQTRLNNKWFVLWGPSAKAAKWAASFPVSFASQRSSEGFSASRFGVSGFSRRPAPSRPTSPSGPQALSHLGFWQTLPASLQRSVWRPPGSAASGGFGAGNAAALASRLGCVCDEQADTAISDEGLLASLRRRAIRLSDAPRGLALPSPDAAARARSRGWPART